eukprot:CAMPEP_0175076960 /NCGR_PEP_ID=MMETSP0052_2-20121109/23075_1 /TAXON_ID=51329 ORGANISM="Polytomella parva, Strain SAG 63-3" /NCGR_SAMPLE_ID=MMETSP0052_2 /ASSEMBLY_ACC=CAM_ASM_000194 /LENGTH=207 /DNA_ID=CAMNT_0016346273 /DNA_START=266 /DNA_END=889 /DNA_ORIENTATION=+
MKLKAYSRSEANRRRTPPPKKPQVDTINDVLSQYLQPAKKPPPPPVPELSAYDEKLAQSFQNLDQVDLMIRQTFGLSTSSSSTFLPDSSSSTAAASAKASCRGLRVGSLTSPLSSIVSIYPDRLEYNFPHPHEGAVRMLMYFRDLSEIRYDAKDMELSYHANRPLAVFLGFYDAADRKHRLSLKFCTTVEADVVIAAVRKVTMIRVM